MTTDFGHSIDNHPRLFTEQSHHDANTQSTIRDLEHRVDKLELINEALWDLLKKKD